MGLTPDEAETLKLTDLVVARINKMPRQYLIKAFLEYERDARKEDAALERLLTSFDEISGPSEGDDTAMFAKIA
ncbi:hypothetical protein [Rhizobium sp. RAF56]|uniref:hypothetical protein n=1 Tax=Rhizobium sp. RAF56 TaxID=3233062 RepID=UPI003F9521B4